MLTLKYNGIPLKILLKSREDLVVFRLKMLIVTDRRSVYFPIHETPSAGFKLTDPLKKSRAWSGHKRVHPQILDCPLQTPGAAYQ